MDKQIKVISVICVALIVVLMISTTTIQVFNNDSLAKNAFNVRTIYEEYGKNRGSINVQTTGNNVRKIAYSKPVDDVFKYQRVYDDPLVYAPITGFYSISNRPDRGIESALDDILSGNTPTQNAANFVSGLMGQDPVGLNVNLTINDALQRSSYETLKDSGFNGAVVAINPKNGEILALASYPTVDYNDFAIHNTALSAAAYTNSADAANSPMLNRATDNIYPPGSTYKLIDSAMLLDSDQYTPDTVVDAPVSYTLPGTATALSNYNHSVCAAINGKQSLKSALAQSCNVPFAILAGVFGADKMSEYAKKFGIGKSYDIINGELRGNDVKDTNLGDRLAKMQSAVSVFPDNQPGDRLAMSAIGQADVALTPLQDCMISAIIANNGKSVFPKIVQNITDKDGKVTDNSLGGLINLTGVNNNSEQLIKENSAKLLTDMMVNNVTNGVASGARVAGEKVAGKTGTAENDPNLLSHSWFTGFAPADDPQIAITVFLQNGDENHGGAAKLAGKIIGNYLSGVNN